MTEGATLEARATAPFLRTTAVPAADTIMHIKTAHDKDVIAFRNYSDSALQARVKRHYRGMRQNQTVAFYEKMEEKYSFAPGKHRAEMTVREAFQALEAYVDSSDPDMDLPNLIHMLQTAEGIRKAGHPDWMQLIGLLHDMGKIQFLWGKREDGQEGTGEGAQWALGGDTWVLGCAIPSTVVFPEFNGLNPDEQDERYNGRNGMYEEGCGIEQLKWAWGHDEYMYRMLVANGATLPKEGLAMVRYHSAYPWHDKGEYGQFMKPGDEMLMAAVKKFNVFDLYTKDEGKGVDVDKVWPYYQGLIEKYLGTGPLRW
ncbi:inositol oxygenase [Nannochloropsis oceanica]